MAVIGTGPIYVSRGGDWVGQPVPAAKPPTNFVGTYVSPLLDNLTWIDAADPSVTGYDIYVNTSGPPVDNAAGNTLVAADVLPGTQAATFTKSGAFYTAFTLYYGIAAKSSSGYSTWVETSVGLYTLPYTLEFVDYPTPLSAMYRLTDALGTPVSGEAITVDAYTARDGILVPGWKTHNTLDLGQITVSTKQGDPVSIKPSMAADPTVTVPWKGIPVTGGYVGYATSGNSNIDQLAGLFTQFDTMAISVASPAQSPGPDFLSGMWREDSQYSSVLGEYNQDVAMTVPTAANLPTAWPGPNAGGTWTKDTFVLIASRTTRPSQHYDYA